jgi:SAM-dependent methyltransferase
MSGWSPALTAPHERESAGEHYIDRASREKAIDSICHHHKKPWRILDIGSSSGYLVRDLRRVFYGATVFGSDIFRTADIQAALPNLPFADDSLDVVTLLNVLEHVEDDVSALCEINRILQPGGILVLEVPACPKLYGPYDLALLHYRRYRMRILLDILSIAGFTIERYSHLGALLFPAFAAVKLWQKWRGGDVRADIKRSDGWLPSLLMRLELALPIRWGFGIRCCVTARK